MTINPIFESSARRRMRTARTPVIITLYLLSLLLVAWALLSGFCEGAAVGQMRKGTEGYIWMTALQLLLIVLVAPALSAGSIAGERERQTFDLLLVTGVGAGRIVTGKLLESFAFLALMIGAGIPVMLLFSAVGGGTPMQVLTLSVYLMVISLEALCVGMLVSVLCSRSLTAMISAYLTVFALGALSWGLAKHGPLAAAYTYESLGALGGMSPLQILMGMPPTVFFNPAVGLVTLLSHQTGILHNTMQNTMRLFDIYSAAKAAGFGVVSAACFAASCLSIAALTMLSVFVLRLKTGSQLRKRK